MNLLLSFYINDIIQVVSVIPLNSYFDHHHVAESSIELHKLLKSTRLCQPSLLQNIYLLLPFQTIQTVGHRHCGLPLHQLVQRLLHLPLVLLV